MSKFSKIKKDLSATNLAILNIDIAETVNLLEENYVGAGKKTETQTIVKSEVERVVGLDEKIIQLN